MCERFLTLPSRTLALPPVDSIEVYIIREPMTISLPALGEVFLRRRKMV